MGLLYGLRAQLSQHVPAYAEFPCDEASVFELAKEDNPCI